MAEVRLTFAAAARLRIGFSWRAAVVVAAQEAPSQLARMEGSEGEQREAMARPRASEDAEAVKSPEVPAELR